MIRNTIGVLCFIASGFFVYMVGLLAWLDMSEMVPGTPDKLGVLWRACIPLAVFHLPGLALYRGANWKTSTGVTLLAGSAVNVLTAISVLSASASADALPMMDTSGLDAFNDWYWGFGVMTMFLGLGLALHWLGKRGASSNEYRAAG